MNTCLNILSCLGALEARASFFGDTWHTKNGYKLPSAYNFFKDARLPQVELGCFPCLLGRMI